MGGGRGMEILMDWRILRAYAMARRLWEQQQPMPAEYSAVVDKRFWELIDTDGKDNK